MAFVTKTWKDRMVEFAGRRKLKNVSTNESVLYDVSRSEGTVMQAGDSFSATNMNDLEQRIKTEFDNVNSSLESQPDFVYDEAGKITGYKTKIGGADTVFPFSNGLNAIITVRSVNTVYSSTGEKYYDTLLDTQFTIKNGKVESTKVITNNGASVGGWSIKPTYSTILSIKDNK